MVHLVIAVFPSIQSMSSSMIEQLKGC